MVHRTPAASMGMPLGTDTPMKYLILTALCLAWLPMPALAQMQTDQSRQALQDIKGFYVRVEVEGSVGLTSEDAVDVRTINRRVKTNLREAGLNVLEASEVTDRVEEPYLYIHLNMMETDNGQIPFAVKTQFFQRVELPRTRQRSLIACTWDDGLVGLSYYNDLNFIADAAVKSVANFILDYHAANP